jgi:outer membrane protein OmpA-like peptidoglycan-associated protein
MRFACLSALVITVLAAAPVRAQDVDGSKDHPMFSRMPGYSIESYDATDFGSADFAVGKDDPQKVEGKFWRIGYTLKEGAKKAGPLQIGRNYTDLVVKRGGRKLLEQLESGGGTTTAMLPAAAGKGALWLQIEVNNNGEAYALIVVEEGTMKQEVEFTAGDLAEALKTKGSVALHNILFDSGKATLTPESAPALGAIGELLTADPSLAIEIQGHTDNVGAAAANLTLSRDRAAAVKAYLVQTLGIAAARLTTAGLGDTRPVADNATEDGRAQNRRVELVKK